VFARFTIENQVTALERELPVKAHIVIAAMPTRFATCHFSFLVYKNPCVFQLIQVSDIPVPPDRIFDSQASGWLAFGYQVNLVTLPERGGEAATAKNGVTCCQRQERLMGIKTNDWSVAGRQRLLAGALWSIE